MSKISQVRAREILDSRGNPTVEVEITLADNSLGRAAVPSGASTGSHEALELRDGDPKRYGGLGVLTAVKNVNELIAPAILGQNWTQRNLDQALIALDGTANKGRLGANAILGVSLAFARAMAVSNKQPLYQYFREIGNRDGELSLPRPMILVLEGGRHAERSSDFQEFMIIPNGATSFAEALRWGAEIYHTIGRILKKENLETKVGDEGAFGPSLGDNEKPLALIVRGIKEAGYEPGKDVTIALDVAASEFYADEKYNLKTENRSLTGDELIAFYKNLVGKYPITSIEDGLAEDDWAGWQKLTAELGNKVQLVGDDLFVTNTKRLREGIEKKVANAILIKPNQIGTITETIDVTRQAQTAGYRAIISHRSGETEDTSIADLAVGLNAGQIKTGAPARSERLAKYNRLLRIEEKLNRE